MTNEFPWTPRRATGAITLQQWMANVDRMLHEATSDNKGLGRTVWQVDQLWDDSRFQPVSSYIPGWRRLQDGRIELRGQLQYGSWDQTGSIFTPAPLTNGTVLLELPFTCSPPTNRQVRTMVTALAPCTTQGDNPGVFRIDIQRGPVWDEQIVVDEDDKPVIGDDGKPVTVNMSKVEVIARPPQNKPITGWVALDGVLYDPNTYIDVLAPVVPSQEPMVEEHGWAIKQHPDGQVQWFKPGVKYSSD